MWLNTESILIAFGQPSEIAVLSNTFILWRIPALIPMVIVEDYKTYLNAQHITQGPMIISAIASVCAVVLFAPLIKGFGFLGAPLSLTISNVIQCMLMLGTTQNMIPNQDAWPRWSVSVALTGWTEMLAISIPAGMMIVFEWLAFEINLFFAGLLCTQRESRVANGEDESSPICVPLDVFPICSNIAFVAFMLLFGHSIAAGTLVGNAMGAGDTEKVQRYIMYLHSNEGIHTPCLTSLSLPLSLLLFVLFLSVPCLACGLVCVCLVCALSAFCLFLVLSCRL